MSDQHLKQLHWFQVHFQAQFKDFVLTLKAMVRNLWPNESLLASEGWPARPFWANQAPLLSLMANDVECEKFKEDSCFTDMA